MAAILISDKLIIGNGKEDNITERYGSVAFTLVGEELGINDQQNSSALQEILVDRCV